jgi:hypothetical protein
VFTGPVSSGRTMRGGGAADGAQPTALQDNAQCIAQGVGARLGTVAQQCIREAMDVLDDMFKFLISGHPAMRPNVGFIDLVSSFLVSFPGRPFFVVRY